MDTGTLVWLVVLLALGGLFALTLRRMSVLVGRTHDLEHYQKLAGVLDGRLALAADPFIAQLDEIRRHSGNAEALAGVTPQTQDELRAIAAEGRSARVPKGLEAEAAAFVVELERAVRAVELVGHGLDALLADRGGRDLEAQTSLKRGALNLRHAREAATRTSGAIQALRPGDLLERVRGTAPLPATRSAATYHVDSEFDDRR
jgi:hypothetical protein